MPRPTASRTKLPPMNPAPPVTSQVVMATPRRTRSGRQASERDVVVREIIGRRGLRSGRLATRRGRSAAVLLALRSRCAVPAAFTAAAEHLHLVGDDVGGVVLDAVLLVGAVFDAALDVDRAPLAQV